MKRIRLYSHVLLLAAAIGCFHAKPAAAAEIASFFQQSGQQEFIFTNNPDDSASLTVDDAPVWFLFKNVTTEPGITNVLQQGLLRINATTYTQASVSGTHITQGGLDGRLTVYRESDLAVLLDVTFFGAQLKGELNAQSAAVLASFTAFNYVNFSSDFADTPEIGLNPAFALSLSSISPLLTAVDGGFLGSFTAAGAGTFSASPLPSDVTVPEPATVAFCGFALVAIGLYKRRSVR